MNKLRFTFESGRELINDVIVNYKKKERGIIFIVQGDTFEINYLNSFKFIKYNEDTIFQITKHDKVITCQYELLSNNLAMTIKLIDFKVTEKTDGYIIKYTLESDIESPKTIRIKFLN